MKMTASLLQACDYYFQNNSERALNQLHDTLTTGFTGNAATRRGEAYENYVNNVLATEGRFNLDIEQEAFEELRGTLQQEWLKPLTLETKYGFFTFKGRTDYRRPDNKMIYDLKTTKKFDEAGYHSKWQHTIYAHAMNSPAFKYVVAVFEDTDSLEPVSIHKVAPIIHPKEELIAKIEECVNFLVKTFREDFEHWAGGKLENVSDF
jgi:hypothetical protein